MVMIPNSEGKRTIMENAYIAAAQVNRLKMLTKESFARYPKEIEYAKQDIEECKQEIYGTQLYQSLSERDKKNLEEQVFKKGEYRMVFTDDGKLMLHVGWNDVREYCRLNADVLDGVYRYACNMAHPSYLGLIQFHEAYKEGMIGDLNDTAILQMIAIMSVFVLDFIEAFPEAKQEYDDLDEESRFMVSMYNDSFRKRSDLNIT